MLKNNCLPVLFIFSLLCFSAKVKAQEVPESLRIKLTATLDSMLEVIGNKSLSAAMQFDDETIWADAAGISSAAVAVTPEFKYEIGSVTKTFTAACILQLVDEGILQLDDSINKWLEPIIYIDTNITIRQLLRHQSGLYEVLANPELQPILLANTDSVWQASDVIATFINPPYNVPGAVWSYCNTGYFLLGMIIEAATGNPYYVEIRNRFLDPLALSSMGIPSFETLSGPIAHVWLDITGDGVTEDAHFFYYNWKALNSVAGAAGGYYSDATDITHWMRTYLRGDLIDAAIMDEAKETVTAPGISGTYGLGLMKKTFKGYTAYGHGGDLSYSANSWYLPDLDLSITVLNNDAEVISWDLEPVTIALLQTYENWKLTLHVDDVVNKVDIKVFPNPTSGNFNIAITGAPENKPFEIKLCNLYGQLVWVKTLSGSAISNGIINCSLPLNLQDGTYFIEINSEKNVLYNSTILKLS
ncbi:MAG: serine hydrolase [Chitinophagales bacterium]